jgi:hypothetical protein
MMIVVLPEMEDATVMSGDTGKEELGIMSNVKLVCLHARYFLELTISLITHVKSWNHLAETTFSHIRMCWMCSAHTVRK